MKTLIKKISLAIVTLAIFGLANRPAFAEVNSRNLAGTWASSCVQSQMNGKQGFTVETYTFDTSNRYTYARHWFKDSSCHSAAYGDDVENGTFKIGSENTNHGFNPEGTNEVAYSHNSGTDLGLIWLDQSSSKMRISRGFGSGQNTMLGLFQFSKI